MIEVELLGGDGSPGAAPGGAAAPLAALPSFDEVRDLCVLAASAAGVSDGHVAIEFVDARRITELNASYRDEPRPTDVLSFPVDGLEPTGPLRELGDVLICPEYTLDVREAIVHGVLHLLGMDHERDGGEMLALQRELLGRAGQ